MNVDRRYFIVSTLGVIGCSGNGITTPSPIPNSNQNNSPLPTPAPILHPIEKVFDDGTKARRIGEVRYAGVSGNLLHVMEMARLQFKTKDNLITQFETVTPASNLGLIFLVRGERFTNAARNVSLNARDEWAAYNWLG
jgi:hypothetical protein